jgi:hypothetical protein
MKKYILMCLFGISLLTNMVKIYLILIFIASTLFSYLSFYIGIGIIIYSAYKGLTCKKLENMQL